MTKNPGVGNDGFLSVIRCFAPQVDLKSQVKLAKY